MADTIMAPRLSEVTGVGHVWWEGGIARDSHRGRSVAVVVNGIGLEILRTAIVGANVAAPRIR